MSNTTLASRKAFDAPCTLDIAKLPESLHAHVSIEGVDLGPGDEVIVHNAPTEIGYGEHIVCNRRATIIHAGWLARWWTRLTSRFELTMLYEVSFTPGRADRKQPRRKA